MKQNFTLVLSYLLYFGMAVFLNPVSNNFKGSFNKYKIEPFKKEKAIARVNTEILHSELLFKY